MNAVNKKKSRLPRIVAILLILLILLIGVVVSLPAIISTAFVRNMTLAKINENPDIELKINDWSVSWFDGIRADGIAVDLQTVPAELTADSATTDISIPAAIKLALTIKKAQTKPITDPGVRAEVKLSNARLTVLSTPETTLENIDFTLALLSLNEKWLFTLQADQQQNEGKLLIEGGIVLLKDGRFDPNRIGGDIEVKVESIAVFPIIAALNTNQAMPDVSGLLNGKINASFAGMEDIKSSGELKLGPIEVKGVALSDETTVFNPLTLTLNVSTKENKLNISGISLESDFTKISVAGTLALNESKKPAGMQLNIAGHLDTDKLTVFAGETFMGWKPDPALLQGGMITIDADIKTDLSQQADILQATSTKASVTMTNVNLGIFSHIPSDTPTQAKADCMLNADLKTEINGPEHIQAEGRITTSAIKLVLPELGDKPLNIAPITLALNIKGEDRKITIDDLSLAGDIITASITGSAELEESGAPQSFDAAITGKLNMPAVADLASFVLKQPLDSNSKPEDWGACNFKADITCRANGSTNLLENLNAAFEAKLQNLHFFPIVKLADENNELPTVNGAMSADITVKLTGMDHILSNIEISSPGIFFASSFFGSDKPAIRNLKISTETELKGDTIKLNSFSLDSSLLNLAVAGVFIPGRDETPHNFEFNQSARLDIAETVKQVPTMLGIKDNLTFTRGELIVLTQLRSKAKDIVFDTSISVGEIEFELDGASSEFKTLLALAAKGVAGDVPRLDELSVTAPFLSGSGSGDLENFQAELKADIGAALRDIGKFVDLAEKSAEGTIDLTLGLSQTSETASALKANGKLSALNVAGFSEKPVTMPASQLSAAAVLNKTPEGALHNISDASFTLTSPLLDVEITNKRFVPGSPEQTMLDDMRISVKSDLATLLAFASELTDELDGISLQGKAALEGKSSISEGILNIPEISLTLDPFEMRTKDGLIVERGITATGNLKTPVTGTDDKPVSPAAITANMNMTAGYIRRFGVEISEVNVPVKISDGIVALRVMSKANEGSVNLPVNIDINVEPNLLTIPDNTLALDKFQLNDAMLEELLGMIAPVLKGCAVTSGDISFRLDRCLVPLDEKHKTDMEFSSSVTFRNVVLAPAGLMLELLGLAGLSERNISVPNQEVATVLQNGRFRSSPLNIMVGPHRIVISGSVGLDETLDYNTQIPLTRELVGKDVYKYVEGQSVTLPIGGTVSSPGIDKKKFAGEIARIIASAAVSEKGKEVIDKGLSEGIKLLDGLLGK